MSTPLKRRLALAAVGAAALGTGLWWAGRRSAPAAGSAEDATATLWAASFDTPSGGTLAFASLRGKPLVLNFWASWCAPCVREMPLLDQFHRESAPHGWQMVGVAIDGPTPVREFLAKTPVSYPIALAGFGGTELSKALGNDAGGLPFTVVMDAKGRVVGRKLGEISLQELQGWTQLQG